MSASASLLALLNCKADLNYYTAQEIYWTHQYDSNSSKLKKLEKYETAWNDAYDKGYAADSDLSVNNQTIVTKGNGGDTAGRTYANAKCPEYLKYKDTIDDLRDLDIEYDTMKTMYDAMMEEKQAEYDSLKEKTSTECQDTHLLGS